MGKKIGRIICKCGKFFCTLAFVVAPFASEFCNRQYYQPIEPKGFGKFAKR